MNHIEAIAEYQCPGCVQGPAAPACPSFKHTGEGCAAHVPGTMIIPHGTICLGLPRGFNRMGPRTRVEPGDWMQVYDSMDTLLEVASLSTIFSVPVWLHIDEHGNTITRWFSPRTNTGWSAVILGDHSAHPRFANCINVTADQIKGMD